MYNNKYLFIVSVVFFKPIINKNSYITRSHKIIITKLI